MISLLELGLAFSALGLSLILTGLMRRYALNRSLLDLPGRRSSHTTPTPSAGGLGIVLTFFLLLSAGALAGRVTPELFLALIGAGGLVAGVGLLDDHRPLPAGIRLACHFAAAGWALLWLAPLPSATVLGIPLLAGWPGFVIALVGLVWTLNLYNFMDGIDGLAGLQAISVSLGMLLLAYLAGANGAWVVTTLLVMAASAGFLFWNIPKARIFMGDVGSGFLGLVMGILALSAAQQAPEFLWAWLILMGVFVVDATVTLARRLIGGEKIFQAHRTHAYQRLARHWRSHLRVSVAVTVINLLGLLPLAAAVALEWLNGPVTLTLAYALLTSLVLAVGAGRPVAGQVQKDRLG